MRVAGKLGMSVAEAMEKISATEFIDWCTLMEMEFNEPSRSDHYTIQLTYFTYMLMFILGGEPKLKPEDLRIKFDFNAAREKMEAELREVTEEEREAMQAAALARQKAWWGAAMKMAGAKDKDKKEKVVTVFPDKKGNPRRIS